MAHTYTTATAGRNTLRRITTTQPGSATITYNYVSTADLHDAEASRVSYLQLQIGAGSNLRVAEYKYNGVGDLVGRDYGEPDVFWRQYSASAGDYPDRDRFDRIIKSRWTKDLSTDMDFFSVDIAYDRASNIVSTEDNVYPAGFDVKYALDNLNRLTDADEGTLSGGSITSRTRRQQWTLTQTGHWDREKLDLTGDGDWSDANEHDETRTHNEVNEILTRDTNSTSPAEYTLTYDAAGNLTDDGETYTYEYDPWYRLRKMKNRSTSALVAEHTYYGNGFRASEKYDTDVDGDVDSHDQTYYFAYDERWRIVATFRASDSDPKERFLHHAAGASGLGGSSYIDDVVLRDRDANTAWTAASDGTLEQRRYYCQNWRHDVVALVTDDGKLAERDRYSSYGVPFGIPLGDVNGDGTVDGSDTGQILADWGTAVVRDDLDLDGDVDGSDHTIANNNFGATLGRQQLSNVRNLRGFAGCEAEVVDDIIMHVRNRIYVATLGQWSRRDPLARDEEPNVLSYGSDRPMTTADPLGLVPILVTKCPFPGFLDAFGPCGQASCARIFRLGGADPCAPGQGVWIQRVAVKAVCQCPPSGSTSADDFYYFEEFPTAPGLNFMFGGCDVFAFPGCPATHGTFNERGEIRYFCRPDLTAAGYVTPALVGQFIATFPDCPSCSGLTFVTNLPTSGPFPPTTQNPRWWDEHKGAGRRRLFSGWGCCPTCTSTSWSTSKCS